MPLKPTAGLFVDGRADPRIKSGDGHDVWGASVAVAPGPASTRRNHEERGEGQLPRSWPPSTEIVWPVTQLAAGETRNNATRATSSGCPRRPNGIERRIAL